MRRAARTDNNHAAIVKAFRQIGATVQNLHAVGGGCPDVLVGFRGVNVLVEIKDGAKAASAQRLTAQQFEWHATWAGQVCIVNSIEDAVKAVIEAAG